MERVLNACFLLGEAVRWEMKRPQWLALEFELLRQAALATQRPGQWMLIQTLEWACRGVAGRVELKEPAEALPTAPHAPVASQWAQAPLSPAQAPEVGPPAPEPLPARGTGTLCANWSSLYTTLREVPPGGATPLPALAALHPAPKYRWALAALHAGGLLALARSRAAPGRT